MERLAGKVAFITGSGAGIGRHAALLFAREAAKVVVADRSAADGRETVRLIEAQGGKGHFVATDVAEEASVQQAVAEAVATYGSLTILYNNAGGSTPKDGPVTDVGVEEFWRAMRVDLFGSWLVCKHGIPHLAAAGGGAIVNTTSFLAFMGFAGFDAYTPAKGGIASLTRSLAVEYAAKNVRVNAVAPGLILTDRVRQNLASGRLPPSLLARNLLGPAEPDAVAYAALYLASDEARWTTGQILHVDSGITVS